MFPQEGSIHGGTLVTITGTGFSVEDREVEVDIDGITCRVRSWIFEFNIVQIAYHVSFGI